MASDYETDPGSAGALREGVRRVRRNRYLGLVVNAAPSALWLTVFFLVPLGVMFYYSFGERGAFGQVLLGLSNIGLQQYATFFVPEGATVPQAIWYSLAWMIEGVLPGGVELAATDPTPYVKLTVKSINFAVVTTLVAFLIGYPMAYYLARNVSSERQNLLIALVVLPYWASYLVRIYAIKLLLSGNGIVPSLLVRLGVTDSPPQLLFTDFSVQFGLVYIWLPFMILPIYASIENLDFTLHEAAMDLGADRLDAFFKVTLPLSMPGVTAGSVLVFIPSVGAYVIPNLLGGPNTATIGNFIAGQFGAAGNWPLGAAASFVLMVIMLGVIAIYMRRAGGDLL
ncbi:ABC transporter permease [Salinirubellus sp. GCM10025818]|uniref:ABC transporter permease n=1 Tax=Salinirubellus TaxID=2162630 RepID=UPI0030CE83CE